MRRLEEAFICLERRYRRFKQTSCLAARSFCLSFLPHRTRSDRGSYNAKEPSCFRYLIVNYFLSPIYGLRTALSCVSHCEM